MNVIKGIGKVIGAIVGVVLISALLILLLFSLPGFGIMLLWGAIAGTLSLTTIGFWTAFQIAWLIAIVGGVFGISKLSTQLSGIAEQLGDK